MTHRHLAALLPLLLLTACVRPVSVTPALSPAYTPDLSPALQLPPRPGGCRLVTAATLDLLQAGSQKPVILVRMNGQDMRMQVDTGAETSLLTTDGAAWLGLAALASRMPVTGLGGTGGYGLVRLESMEFAGAILHALDLPVMQLGGAAGLPGSPPALAGLIGADLLAGFEVDFDFAAGRMTLRRAYGCDRPAPDWAGRYTTLDWRSPRSLPFVPVQLDGHVITALIDTGAVASAVARDSSNVGNAALEQDPRIESYGAGKMAIQGRSHRFGLLRVGTLNFSSPKLRVVNIDPATGIDLLIGMDLLANHRLWLDFAGRRTFLQAEQ